MKIQDLSLWEAFYWVAQDGSFTKAARRLRLGTPVLSKKISNLERSLGVRLFLRSTRTLSLTTEARVILASVETLLEDYRGIEERFQSAKDISGTIRLTCTAGLANRLLAPILIDFCRMHPKINFEVDASDRIANLIEEQIDIAIRIQQPPAESEFVYKRLAPNNLIFCASVEYLKQCQLPLKSMTDLNHHPLVMFRVYERCVLEGTDYKLKDFLNTKRIDANSGTFLTELALRGAGVAVRSIWDVREFIEIGKLKQVLPQIKIVNPVDIYAVIPGRRLMTMRVRAFLDFLEARAQSWV